MPDHSYHYKRVVRWGDCDPAGIAYTPRIFDYLTEALESWTRDVLGLDWVGMIREHGLGTPVVHAEADMLSPMRPDLALDIEVRLEELGTASMTFAMTGRDAAGAAYFRGRIVACVIEFASGRASPIPDGFRRRLRPAVESIPAGDSD